MDFLKDICAFCENTTRNFPKVSHEYLNSIISAVTAADIRLNMAKIFSANYDVALPLLKEKDEILFWGVRKGKYCNILDKLGNDNIGLNFLSIIPPIQTNHHVFVVQNPEYQWGVVDLSASQKPLIIVPFGRYKYIWGFNTNHALVSTKGIGKPGTFEGRGIINSEGKIKVGFKEYRDIWDFYNNNLPYITAETFEGSKIYLLKRDLSMINI